MEISSIILIVFGIGIVIFIAFFFSKNARMRRAIRNAPVTNIRQVIEGETIRIVGKTYSNSEQSDHKVISIMSVNCL